MNESVQKIKSHFDVLDEALGILIDSQPNSGVKEALTYRRKTAQKLREVKEFIVSLRDTVEDLDRALGRLEDHLMEVGND